MTRNVFEKFALDSAYKIGRMIAGQNRQGIKRWGDKSPPTTRLNTGDFLKGAMWAFDHFQLEKENETRRLRETLTEKSDRKTTRTTGI